MDFFENLQDLFPNHNVDSINHVIQMVMEEIPHGEHTEKLERMCTLLLDDCNSKDAGGFDCTSDDDSDQCYNSKESIDDINYNVQELLLKRFPDACPAYIHDILNNNDVSHDFSNIVQQFKTNGYIKRNAKNATNTKLKNDIKQIFSDVCEMYLDKCIAEGFTLNQIMDKFLNEDYVKKSPILQQQSKVATIHQHFCDILPKFDPDYLFNEAKNLEHSTESAISDCIARLLEMTVYPTIDDYNKRQTRKNKMLEYVFHFKIDSFLREFSYSTDCFENNERTHSLQNIANSIALEEDKNLAEVILHIAYKDQQPNLINSMLRQYNYDIVKACNRLGAVKHIGTIKEEDVVLPKNSFKNKLLFQELGFVLYRPLIMNYQQLRKTGYERAYKEAEAAQKLETCKCCYEEGLLLLPEECYVCRNGCTFCKECMTKGCEVAYGDGRLDIECFAQCGGTFSDDTLQMVMDVVAFTKLMQRKQIKEIRDASIDGFETCPFCEFGTVLPKEEKIFTCLNSECGKESCRECRHVAHIPLRCNEIEYDEDVKMRTHIENQMTAALIRTCKMCSKSFIKEQGCNMMTCPCGTTMCYVCGASGISYKHFKNGSCQQQSNQEQLHRNNVLDAVRRAKAELGVDTNSKKLKFDPSQGY